MANKRERNRYRITTSHAVVLDVQHEDGTQLNSIEGELVDLSESGARLILPSDVMVARTLRLHFRVEALSLEFAASAAVCWKKPQGDKWMIGCSLSPSLPAVLFGQLTHGADLERITAARPQVTVYLESESEYLTAALDNYSPGGFCLSIPQAIPTDERIRLYFDETATFIVARTVWQVRTAEESLVGATYINIHDHATLQDICNGFMASPL